MNGGIGTTAALGSNKMTPATSVSSISVAAVSGAVLMCEYDDENEGFRVGVLFIILLSLDS